VKDLSKAKDVQAAVNALFEKAAGDVETSFTSLASARINSRSFGRATTGSEYDLVDIQSLAGLMQKKYPAEAKQVADQAKAMTVISRSNTDDACGVSLYYPFYNKSSYEEKWKEAYSQVEGFEAYCKYLENYEQRWLGTDLRRIFADVKTPKVTEEGDYFITLTDEQLDQYAEGGYYILEKNGGDNYTVVFSSSDVDLVDHELRANFENKILYFTNDAGNRNIVPVREWDTVDNVTRYSSFPRVADLSDDKDTKMADTELQFSLDRDKETVEVTAFLESDNFVKDLFKGDNFGNVTTGKRSEVDTSKYESLFFNANNGRYLHRDNNGILYDYWDWPEDDDTMVHSMYALSDGIGFEYLPLYDDGFEYFLMIRYRDLQGNGYCSEPIPITAVENEHQLDKKSYDWKDSPVFTLYEDDEVKASIYCMISPESNAVCYSLMIENNTDVSIKAILSNLMLNETIRDGYNYFYEAYVSAHGYKVIPLKGLNEALSFMGKAKPDSLSFEFTMQQVKGYYISFPVRTLYPDGEVEIRVSDSVYPTQAVIPYHGAMADPQEVAVIDDVHFELMQCGQVLDDSDQSSGYGNMTLLLKVENQSEEERVARLYGIVAGDYYVENNKAEFITLSPGQTGYLEFSKSVADIENPDLNNIGSLSLVIKALPLSLEDKQTDGWGDSWQTKYKVPDYEEIKPGDYYPVELSDNDGQTVWEVEPGKTLYADDDLSIYDAGVVVKDDLGDKNFAYLWIENHSDNYFKVSLEDILIDGVERSDADYSISTTYDLALAPGTGAWYYIKSFSDEPFPEIKGTLCLGDWTDHEPVATLTVKGTKITCEEVRS
ncbi:MAG: hypothetical protein KBS83_02590, partial [Lachnospiraceae bacterium]|nr:hypothetical protein [Candidatus Equihabitans merdae]